MNKEEHKQYMRQYRIINKDRLLKQSKEHYQKNKDTEKIRCKEYHNKNKEKIAATQKIYTANNKPARKEYIKKYYAKNKEKYVIYSKKYHESVRTTPKYKFSRYKRGAKVRGIKFELSFYQFISFWKKPCEYCGDEIKTIGLDRLNNDKGYSMDNVVPCCTDCNRMKMAMDKNRFIEKCFKIIKNNKFNNME